MTDPTVTGQLRQKYIPLAWSSATDAGIAQSGKKIRLDYLVSHPIQSQAPLLRRVAQEPDIDLTVFFAADFSVRGYEEKGFGVEVKWDVPLLAGYRHEFLPPLRKDSKKLKPSIYGLISRLRGKHAQSSFDVLWIHGYSTLNFHGILAARSLGISVLLQAESSLDNRYQSGSSSYPVKSAVKRLFLHLLKHMVDGVLPIGSLNAAYWTHYLGTSVPQFPMPYTVDNSYFQQCAERAGLHRSDLREQLQLDASRPVLLFAARLQKRKGCVDLRQAYIDLCADPSVNPQPYLLIVGDGEERLSLEQQAAASGLAGIRFCCLTNQSKLGGFYDLATLFILPSRPEPSGLTVNEVMNAGCAVLLSEDVGCYPDLVTEGVEGMIFPVGDVAALRKALQCVLSDRAKANAMEKSASARIEEWNFDKDIQGLRRAIAQITGGIEG